MPFSEDDRMRRYVYFIRAVEARAVELFRVLGIILAYAEDIAASQWREYLDINSRERSSCRGDLMASRFNDLIEVVDWRSGPEAQWLY